MITEGQFYDQVISEFREINRKIDENHKDTNEKIVDLCDKISDVKTDVAKVQSEICTHLEVVKAVDSNETGKIEHRDRNFYIAIALVGVATSIVGIVF